MQVCVLVEHGVWVMTFLCWSSLCKCTHGHESGVVEPCDLLSGGIMDHRLSALISSAALPSKRLVLSAL